MEFQTDPTPPATPPVAVNELKIVIPPVDLPEWIEESYPEALKMLLFRLILGYLESPHKHGHNAGYTQVKLLIPLWLALGANRKHIALLMGKLNQDLAARKAKVAEIREALQARGEERRK